MEQPCWEYKTELHSCISLLLQSMDRKERSAGLRLFTAATGIDLGVPLRCTSHKEVPMSIGDIKRAPTMTFPSNIDSDQLHRVATCLHCLRGAADCPSRQETRTPSGGKRTVHVPSYLQMQLGADGRSGEQ